jgi:N-acetylmuramoyl-L-alanine amidase
LIRPARPPHRVTSGTTGKINATNVNFRTGPSTSYIRLGQLQKQAALTILEQSGDWYKVTVVATGKTGYVYGDYVTIRLDGRHAYSVHQSFRRQRPCQH